MRITLIWKNIVKNVKNHKKNMKEEKHEMLLIVNDEQTRDGNSEATYKQRKPKCF